MVVKIKENSWLAWLAAKRLKTDRVAMVLGNTIHLHNTSRQDFLRNEAWLKHEIAHVRQYQKYGGLKFLWMYLKETIQRGYYNNRLETEARIKETDEEILKDIVIE
jgi:hypothetical protein